MVSHQINTVIDSAYTVQDLINELSSLDPDARVLFSCGYGDIGNTPQALPVTHLEHCDSTNLHDSAYSISGVSINENDEYEDEDGDEECEVTPLIVLMTCGQVHN